MRKRDYDPIITLGDGLVSFFDKQDPYTKELGPLSAADVRNADVAARARAVLAKLGYNNLPIGKSEMEALGEGFLIEARPWNPGTRRWFHGASRPRWFMTYAL